MPNDFVGIGKQHALEDAEKPESETKEGITTVSVVTGELGLNIAVIKASDDEQRTAGRHIIWMLACYADILKGKNRSSSHLSSMLDFFKVIFGESCIITYICWTM
jgi:hypothetical protein